MIRGSFFMQVVGACGTAIIDGVTGSSCTATCREMVQTMDVRCADFVEVHEHFHIFVEGDFIQAADIRNMQLDELCNEYAQGGAKAGPGSH